MPGFEHLRVLNELDSGLTEAKLNSKEVEQKSWRFASVGGPDGVTGDGSWVMLGCHPLGIEWF